MKKLVLFFAMAIVAVMAAMAAGKQPVTINDENYTEYLSDASKPLVLKFSATWCGPCKTFTPIYHKVAEKMGGSVNFYMVDVDESPELSGQMGISAVPTVIIINPANENVDVIEGVVDEAELTKRIKAIF